MAAQRWTRDELLVAFNLYCKTPFGRMHSHNPEVINLSQVLGRSPNAVAMKLTNLASFDPELEQRGVRGLAHASRNDKEVFEEFYANPEALANESELVLERLVDAIDSDDRDIPLPAGPTEETKLVRTRRVQRFFRQAVMANYNYSCAISGIRVPDLLNASHIIPWQENVERRADPRNGIALCTIYDRAFDRGLLTIDTNWRVHISPILRKEPRSEMHDRILISVNGMTILIPRRARPDQAALEYHRTHIFRQTA